MRVDIALGLLLAEYAVVFVLSGSVFVSGGERLISNEDVLGGLNFCADSVAVDEFPFEEGSHPDGYLDPGLAWIFAIVW